MAGERDQVDAFLRKRLADAKVPALAATRHLSLFARNSTVNDPIRSLNQEQGVQSCSRSGGRVPSGSGICEVFSNIASML